MCLNGVSNWIVLKISCGKRKTQIKSEFQLQNAGFCKMLLTCRRMLCVSADACSGSVEVLSVYSVSHFNTVRCKLTPYAMYVQRKTLASFPSQCYSGKTTMHSMLFLELDDTFNSLNKWMLHRNTLTENLLTSAVKKSRMYSYGLLDGALKQKNIRFLTAILN